MHPNVVEFLLEFLPQLLIPVAVVTVLHLLRRYWKPDEAPKDAWERTPSIEELGKRFRKTEWGTSLLLLGCMAVFASLTWKLLRLGNRWVASQDGASMFQLYPSEAVWWFFPGFGALTFGWLITELLLPLFLGKETAQEYWRCTNAKAGFHALKAFRWGALVVATPIGILTLLAMPVHTSFQAQSMTFRPYASLEATSYRYEQIKSLTTTDGYRNRAGKFVRAPRILIDFEDGTRWSSGDLLRDPDPSIDEQLKEFLAERSGVPFGHVRLEYDLSGNQ